VVVVSLVMMVVVALEVMVMLVGVTAVEVVTML